ncbi:alpha-hydroxy-acid oxidizing protein [Bradyrhizobium sp. ISRA442]|uniref:alpha-hydroxy acid oxidase n=1 Tax=Bradyrhizobium sp. ISRA442 TaxID=2866197 RepID=UPI00311AF19C
MGGVSAPTDLPAFGRFGCTRVIEAPMQALDRFVPHRIMDHDLARLLACALAGFAGAVAGVALARRGDPIGHEPNRHTQLAQLNDTPSRRYYTGFNPQRAIAISDLRAMSHKRLPRFALEYLEGGAEDEAAMFGERHAFADWRFMPRTLVDVSRRTLATGILGRSAAMPLVVSPTGLNGILRTHGDSALAQAALRANVPFVQSTMSNDTMEQVARAAPGVRHWWQLYVFGGDEIWQELLRRAERVGCEALVLTTNAQIFGDREWQRRNQIGKKRLSASAALESLTHPLWFAENPLSHGLPNFANIIEFVPRDQRSFFAASSWIRMHQPTSLGWDTVAKIRERWKKPFILKGILCPDDVRRALDSGVDGVVLSSHGGRQLDWTISPLDLLPVARDIVDQKMALYMSGGIRRGTDMLKACALGADAVWVGRAPLYGLCAAGAAGAVRALEILKIEALDAMGLLGVSRVDELGPHLLAHMGLVRREPK